MVKKKGVVTFSALCCSPPLQAACQSPAVYELLPPLDFPFSQPPPQLTLWLKTPIPEQLPAGEGQPPVLCASHTTYTMHSPAVGAASGAPSTSAGTHPAAPQLPRISLAVSQLTGSGAEDGGTIGPSTDSIFQAHQYVFKHDALPGLLARLLKDNTGGGQTDGMLLPFCCCHEPGTGFLDALRRSDSHHIPLLDCPPMASERGWRQHPAAL